ncbi:DNA topoisomerase [Alsobacter metallidurans]|uniref:DNA topoisomerase n=1 Tax=Alsobacter metallidurans TaxID=340221 RepID=A0A917ID24_9HYPH|nr:DNA topoisomerase IB [Alsobacter metallidurans]GGH32645.1 DNA topoisomerase [Alsobacter metallidurans]
MDSQPSELPDDASPLEQATNEAQREAAEQAGLVYVSDEEPGFRRRRSGKGVSYLDLDGKAIRDPKTLERIRKLAVPPAYTDVWICPDPNGHIQATGRDDKGRKQYRYHPRWREVRDSDKFEHMLEFAKGLPALRERIDADMGKRGLPREKVLATVVQLLENTLIRVGNADYVKQNKSYGLTTLQDRHVKIDGQELRFAFKGKSGKTWKLKVKDRRIARLVKACQDIPGQHLFQYFDENGERQPVTSADVNAYLKEATGRDITAKDFRTWAGTVLAAMTLREFETVDNQARTKKTIKAAVERVAIRLGNTPTICRKCYVHPEVFNAYLDGGLVESIEEEVDAELRDNLEKMKPEEAAILVVLQRRLKQDLRSRLEKSVEAVAEKPARKSARRKPKDERAAA